MRVSERKHQYRVVSVISSEVAPYLLRENHAEKRQGGLMILDNAPQDRLILELYAWICIDPKTSLEGIAGFNAANDVSMQAVTSSRQAADSMGELYRILAKYTGKKFKLVKFGSPAILEELG